MLKRAAVEVVTAIALAFGKEESLPTSSAKRLVWAGLLLLSSCGAGDAVTRSSVTPRGANPGESELDSELLARAGAAIVASYEGPLLPDDPHGESPARFRPVKILKGGVKPVDFVTPADLPAYRGFTPQLRAGRRYVVYVSPGQATDNLVSGEGPKPGLSPFASSIIALRYWVENTAEAAERQEAEVRWEKLEHCRFGVDDWQRARANGGPTQDQMTCAVHWAHEFLNTHEDRQAIVEVLGEPDQQEQTGDVTSESYALNARGALHPTPGELIGRLELGYATGCRAQLVQIRHKTSFEIYEGAGFRAATLTEQRKWALTAGTTLMCAACDAGPRRCDTP